MDFLLWQERRYFITVVGEKGLENAREQHKIPRSHWWWYLDEIKATPTKYGAMEQDVLWNQKVLLVERVNNIERTLEFLKRDIIKGIEPSQKEVKTSLYGSIKGGDITEEMIDEAKRALFRDLEDI